jgi:transcriptional regulator with XRE-family HTH domain
MLGRITPVDAHLAKKLREFRLISGMTQEKLGELTGVTFQQIQKYEKAKNRISASKLFEFAQILEQPVQNFFAEVESDRSYYNYDFVIPKKQKEKIVKLNKEILPLVKAFNRIESQSSKKSLVALANSISGVVKEKKVKHQYS